MTARPSSNHDAFEMTDEQRKAEAYAAKLQQLLDDSLVSVVLYGSVARGEQRAGRTDTNLLVIASTLGVDELRTVAGSAREWVAAGNPPPMMLSLDEWSGSADVFPLEYSDIRDAHILLAGRDPFEGMRIRRDHLRLQVEREFRSKKIQLREGYLATGDSPEELGILLVRSLSTFLTLFRALLRLADKPVPQATPELIATTAAQVGFDASPLMETHRARLSGQPPTVDIRAALPAAYLGVVERCVVWLDGYTSDGFGEEI